LAAWVSVLAFLSLGRPLSVMSDATEAGPLRFRIRFGPGQSPEAVDGRLLLLISSDGTREPRFQIAEGPKTQLVFGIDVGMKPGEPAAIDAGALGYPLDSIRDVPAGSYSVQALLHRYETFHRADGHTVKLPMDRGEGQQWNRAPGNLYSTPRAVAIDPAKTGAVDITLDRVIAPIPDPPATKYVKHERIQSERLTRFWGRPFFLGAHVLLPEGYDEHPQARYPLVIFHGHFPQNMEDLRETPPDPNLKCEYSDRFRLDCYNRIQQEQAYQFYKDWTSPGYPAPSWSRAGQPLLRRLLRGELGQPRALRRRDHIRADPLPREEVPGHRSRLGAIHVRGLDGGLGGDGRADLLSGRVQRRLLRVPRPQRFPRLHRGRSTRTRTPTGSTTRGSGHRVPRCGTTWGM
jgi:hypothetical protein